MLTEGHYWGDIIVTAEHFQDKRRARALGYVEVSTPTPQHASPASLAPHASHVHCTHRMRCTHCMRYMRHMRVLSGVGTLTRQPLRGTSGPSLLGEGGTRSGPQDGVRARDDGHLALRACQETSCDVRCDVLHQEAVSRACNIRNVCTVVTHVAYTRPYPRPRPHPHPL